MVENEGRHSIEIKDRRNLSKKKVQALLRYGRLQRFPTSKLLGIFSVRNYYLQQYNVTKFNKS